MLNEPKGLTSQQVLQRLAADGPNELPHAPRRTLWRIAREVAEEPMFQLLGAAVAIYAVLGDVSEAGGLLVFLAVIVGMTLFQERRTERALEALHDMTNPRAQVRRDGQWQRVAANTLVCGDLIALAEGERIPADARLLESNDLAVDESLLSGESLPVAKGAGAQNQVFAGTMVVAGQGVAEVTATGIRSEIGRIGKVLGTIEAEVTPLHRQTRQLVKLFSVLGLGVSLWVGAMYIGIHGDWLGGVLAGITMAMSMLPQEFLLILTVFMAMGAWRLSRHNVLTRRSATIEALGSATVLCTDKTGTLTYNRMSVEALTWMPMDAGVSAPQHWVPPMGAVAAQLHPLLQYSLLACERDPVDPMERAILNLAKQQLPRLDEGWQLVHEYGLSPDLPAMTHVWAPAGSSQHVVATKGAPEAVARLCQLPPDRHAQLLAEANLLATQGMRVLAVASATWDAGAWPASPMGFNFQLLGLLALADPLRETVPQAVAECRSAGIRVAMITGDHPGTAMAIARQAGIDTAGGLLRGDELAALSDAELRTKVATVAVFARVAPQQKLRIVEALKANGEIVAMTGDGVNDAPSLKAAHIGIAMGGRGTDVAREAASLVLLDDDFGTLVKAIRLGRRIFDNLRKAMRFVFAVHVPIAGLTVIPLMFGGPMLFTPMHIAFLEIAIDPVCSIVFEAEDEEADVMNRPPRDATVPLFSPGMIAASLLQGLLVLLPVGALYAALLNSSGSDALARTCAFMALVLSNVALILSNRTASASWRAMLGLRNQVLWITLLATLAMLAAAIAIPPLRSLFGFELPGVMGVTYALGVAVVVFVLLMLQKFMGHRWH